MQQLEKNFEDIATAPDYQLGVTDPNNTAIDVDDSDYQNGGKFKITKTDMSGQSGTPTGSDFSESTPGMKAMMPTANDDGGKGENGFNINRNVPILTFGDPNNSADDAKDTTGDNDVFSNYKGSYDFKGGHDTGNSKLA